MALTLYHLDETTRRFMLEEILYDRMYKRLYYDPWLTVKGRKDFPSLLQQASEFHDDSWLAEQLTKDDHLTSRTWNRKGHQFLRPEVPLHIAETEFNRYYIRALCHRALLENQEQVRTYQAKPILTLVIQKQFQPGLYAPKNMLQESRAYVIGAHIAGIPGGPGSGISVRFM